jgi:uncharacterized protein YcbX
MAAIEIGRVAALNRFPVKSMRAEPLAAATLSWIGLEGDRQYAFVRSANRSHFPWLTGRELPALVLHQGRFADPADPRRGPVRVTTPEGEQFDIADPALAARLSAAAGEAVHLMQIGRGAFDCMPVSVLTGTTAARIEAAHGSALGIDRYRANIVLESAGAETDWRGGTLSFGEGGAKLRLDCGIPRCAMITIDPETAGRQPPVLRTVAQQFGNEVGMYAAVVATGVIRTGDAVWYEAA